MRFSCGCSLDADGTRLESCPKPNSEFCTAADAREYDQAPASTSRCRVASPASAPGSYERFAAEIGRLLDQKQQRYGDSFHRAHEVLRILYPTGIPVEHYHLMMFMCRSLDKWFRLAKGGPDQEDPIADLAGYALLMAKKS